MILTEHQGEDAPEPRFEIRHIEPGIIATIPLDTAPLGSFADGSTYNVLARIGKEEKLRPGDLLLTSNDGNIALHKINENLEAGEALDIEYGKISSLVTTDEFSVKVLFPRSGKQKRPLICFLADDEESFFVQAAPDALNSSEAKQVLAELDKEKRARVRRRIAKLATAVALTAIVNISGDMTDSLLDVNTDAKSVVEQTFQAKNDKERAAIERVARIMQDLDDHNYESISQRAEVFRKNNAQEFLTSAETEKYKNQIENARTNEEVLSAISQFMSIYDKRVQLELADSPESNIVEFDMNTSPNVFQEYARAIVDVYSSLPKSLIKEAYFKTIAFGSSRNSANGEGGGNYDLRNGGKINIAIDGSIPNLRQWSRRLIRHETAHAINPNPELFGVTGKRANSIQKARFFIQDLVGLPSDVTLYAAVNGRDEKYADSLTSLLSPETNYLAHPDRGRLFQSDANKQLLERLIELDERFGPGMAEYIVVNSGVMKK